MKMLALFSAIMISLSFGLQNARKGIQYATSIEQKQKVEARLNVNEDGYLLEEFVIVANQDGFLLDEFVFIADRTVAVK